MIVTKDKKIFLISNIDKCKNLLKKRIIKINQIINVENFSNKVLEYDEKTKPPVSFIEYTQISDLPHSIRDLSFSVKDFSKLNQLNDYILNFDDEFLKEVFVFDFFNNEKNAEIKIGFRFIFQSSDSTITESQVNDTINVIIDHTEEIDGITIPGLT